MAIPTEHPLRRVGTSPLSIFYQGVSHLSLEDCTHYLEKAAERDFTINLRLYPMSKDIMGFLIVKSNAGRIVTNGLGSLHRLDGGPTRVICEVPRFSRQTIMLGLLFVAGALALALFAEVRPMDRVLLIGVALVFAAPVVKREYYRSLYGHQLLDFVKVALSPATEFPLLP
jgi:hypothetical protein